MTSVIQDNVLNIAVRDPMMTVRELLKIYCQKIHLVEESFLLTQLTGLESWDRSHIMSGLQNNLLLNKRCNPIREI